MAPVPVSSADAKMVPWAPLIMSAACAASAAATAAAVARTPALALTCMGASQVVDERRAEAVDDKIAGAGAGQREREVVH